MSSEAQATTPQTGAFLKDLQNTLLIKELIVNTRRIKKGWMNLKIKEVILETHDTKTFIIEDADEGGRPWDFYPGQYLTFRFDGISEKPVVRSYSLSSSPNQPDFSAFTVKEVDQGLVSRWLLNEAKKGDILRARGPIGKFYLDPMQGSTPVMMIAGGSGVTPFVSIMREAKYHREHAGLQRHFSLLVSYRSREDLILYDELKKIQLDPFISTTITLTRDLEAGAEFWKGRISPQILKKFTASADLNNTLFMSCGPDEMMKIAVDFLKDQGVPDERIMTESFT